jgi:hypothetical protein
MNFLVFRCSVGLSVGSTHFPSTSREAPHSYQFTHHKTQISRKTSRDLYRIASLCVDKGHASGRGLPLPRRRAGDVVLRVTAAVRQQCAGKRKNEWVNYADRITPRDASTTVSPGPHL